VAVAAAFGFPRACRLRKRREFLLVQGRGRRLSGRHLQFIVLGRKQPPTSAVAASIRFGITVTRKVGNAVTRNRLKRLIRERCRHVVRSTFSGLDVVILVRASAATAPNAAIAGDFLELARRLPGAGAA
jgi:ribonuclease P protein component